MNFIERVLIEKAGHENGFENVLTSDKELVLLGSASHRAQAIITKSENKLWLEITSTVSPQLSAELARSFPTTPRIGIYTTLYIPPKFINILPKLKKLF